MAYGKRRTSTRRASRNCIAYISGDSAALSTTASSSRINSIPRPVCCVSYHTAACPASNCACGCILTLFKSYADLLITLLVLHSRGDQIGDLSDMRSIAPQESGCVHQEQEHDLDPVLFDPKVPERTRFVGF